MKWIAALKLWNAEHNPTKWCVPRKGSPEHAMVRRIMAEGGVARDTLREEEERMARAAPAQRAAPVVQEEIDYDALFREARTKEIGTGLKKEKVKAFLKKLLERRKAAKGSKDRELLEKRIEILKSHVRNRPDDIPLQITLSDMEISFERGLGMKGHMERMIGVEQSMKKMREQAGARAAPAVGAGAGAAPNLPMYEDIEDSIIKKALKYSEKTAGLRAESKKPGKYDKDGFIREVSNAVKISPWSVARIFKPLPDEFELKDLKKLEKSEAPSREERLKALEARSKKGKVMSFIAKAVAKRKARKELAKFVIPEGESRVVLRKDYAKTFSANLTGHTEDQSEGLSMRVAAKHPVKALFKRKEGGSLGVVSAPVEEEASAVGAGAGEDEGEEDDMDRPFGEQYVLEGDVEKAVRQVIKENIQSLLPGRLYMKKYYVPVSEITSVFSMTSRARRNEKEKKISDISVEIMNWARKNGRFVGGGMSGNAVPAKLLRRIYE